MSINFLNVEERSCEPQRCRKKVTQVSNKGCTLFEDTREKSRSSIKGRLFEGSIGLRGGSMVYFVRGDNC